MSNQAQYLSGAVLAAGALGSAYCAYHIYQKINKTKLPKPEEWRRVGTLSDLYVYPIKSCGSVKLEQAVCTQLGLKDGWLRDRTLMVVSTKNNNFVTARVHSEMLLVHPTVRNCILTLNHVDMEPLHINLAEVIALGSPETATVWKCEVPVYDCGPEASQWISKVLDSSADSFKLVYYATQSSRKLRQNDSKLYVNFKKDDTGALPDEVPYNLINQASVDDLNTRMENSKVTPRNFRPNFVLKGAKAYEEDTWKFVKIGENVFEILKPCTRCVLTTIDPETGVRDTHTEPLETLRSYRMIEDPVLRKAAGNSPRMGLQMSLRSGNGRIASVHDPIYVV